MSPLTSLQYKQRQPPSKDLLVQLCGASRGRTLVMSRLYEGLQELPFKPFYPSLDFEELAAFAVGCRQRREDDTQGLGDIAESGNIYDLFKGFYREGVSSLAKYQSLSDQVQEEYDRLNPYQGRDRELRLHYAGQRVAALLLEALGKPVRYNKRFTQQFSLCAVRRSGGYSAVSYSPKPVDGKAFVTIYTDRLHTLLRRYPLQYQITHRSQK